MAAWPLAARAQQPNGKQYLDALEKAKNDYEKISNPSEAARSDYITRLVRLREKAAGLNTDEWQAIDAEIKRHPAPSNADSKILSRLRVGKWQSPRHEYLYRANGTWTMLPAKLGGEPNTNGTWRIQGNQYFDSVGEERRYALILVTKKDFVFSNEGGVFYETRLK